MSVIIDGTNGITTPGVVNSAAETIATTLTVASSATAGSLIVKGSTSGSITIVAPAVAGTNTITLPSTGTFITEGVTLLGTLTTTSGTTQTLSGLDLTSYKQVELYFNNVGSGTTVLAVNSTTVSGVPTTSASHWGLVKVNLSNGAFSSMLRLANNTAGVVSSVNDSGASGNLAMSTATTSIVIGGGGTFTRGTVTIYGMK